MSLRVLVVDDDPDNADSLALLLRLRGHDARVAYDGAAALVSVKERPADVVLMDWAMPGLDGGELARRLREEDGMRSALLVCVSGYGQDDDRRQAKEAGFDHHFTKPLFADDLLGLLSSRQ